jgi:hemerythrin-like domain-containing protein
MGGDGRLPQEQASQLLALLVRLRDLYRHHIATEDNEIFPAAAIILSAPERQAIGNEMALRRGIPCET